MGGASEGGVTSNAAEIITAFGEREMRAWWSRLKQCQVKRGLVGGVLVLLVVDFIWVACAAITKVRKTPPEPSFVLSGLLHR